MKPRVLTQRLVSLAILLVIALLVLATPLSRSAAGTGGGAVFCLGFVLLFGYYVAKILVGVRLPMITSYILVGVMCGPFALNLLSHEVLGSIRRLDDVALAIVALVAGGEMRLRVLRTRGRILATTMAGQMLFAFIGAMAVVLLMQQSAAGFVSGTRGVVAVGLLYGLALVALSPATTIGVVTEKRARGPVTEILVGVTVLLDVVVLFLAALLLPLAETMTSGAAFSVAFARELVVHVVGSVAAGLVFGVVIRMYVHWVYGYLPLFLLGMGLIGSDVCRLYHLEPLLAFMIAGFYVENFSTLGDRMIRGLERSALPVYVMFFTVAGASIDLAALKTGAVLAGVLVVVRAAGLYLGTVMAASADGTLRPYRHRAWTGYLSQAGVSIGIAALIADRFQWGPQLETVVLAVVAINQLGGPVALSQLIDRAGESGGMDRG